MEPSFFIDPLSRIEFSLDDIDAIGQICIQCVVLAGGYLSSRYIPSLSESFDELGEILVMRLILLRIATETL